MMRNDPAEDVVDRPWAVASGILFAQLSVAKGVLVVNDPASLANAVNKTYFQHFPEAVRPRTLISRDPDEIATFVSESGDSAVIKPLQGSGGSGVFLVTGDESPNLNQMIEAVARDGYIVAQEFLPDAEHGDVRMFVMNGEPLQHNGTYAAFRRVNQGSDLRSNMHVGGKARRVKVTDRDARGGRGSSSETPRRRDVPGRSRPHRLEADGGQRVQSRRPRQLSVALPRQLRRDSSSKPSNARLPFARNTAPTSTTPASPPSDPCLMT